MSTFTCIDCKKTKPIQKNGGTGYANDLNNPVCYDCCGKHDWAYMKKHGRITLYLTEDGVANWPGTLKFKVNEMKTGRHNIARVRYDVWFTDKDGRVWHGVQYGDNTQLCHCKRKAA